MSRLLLLGMFVLLVIVIVPSGGAQDKIELGEPSQGQTVLEGTSPSDLAKELADMPDGVLKVKAYDDGSFKSLVVKATVEIEDVLGGDKGKRLARKDAEIQCKRALSQWLNESCVFVETSNKTTTIITKGDSSQDAAGNKVTLRTQEGSETKTFTESHESMSEAVLRGLIVLHTEVSQDSRSFSLIMGLSQKSMNQALSVKGSLSSDRPTGPVPGGAPVDDKGKPESKTNPEAADFM